MAAKLDNTQPARARGTGSPDLGAEPRATTADTIPPMPLKDLLSAGGANIFVLSQDAELIDVVRRAGGDHYPVIEVAEWSELELAVDTQRCGIALLDADLLGKTLTARIAALAPHSHRLVVLVAAERAVAQTLMSLLSDRKIHRLLIKPPALGITRLLVDSAVNRCLQLRELAKAGGDTALPDMSTAPGRTKRAPVSLFVMAGAALLAGVLAVVFVPSLWRAEGPEDTSPARTAAIADTVVAPERADTTPAEASPAAEPPRFAELLARAEQAFGAGRLATPTGDNALDYYLVILAAEPAEPGARAGLGRVIDALFMQAEEALLADDKDATADALAHVRRADPTSSRLAFLDTQLERARAVAARPVQTRPVQERPAAVEAPPPVVTAPRPAANAPGVDLAAELVASARQKIESGDLDTAAVLAAEASRRGANPALLEQLEADIAAGWTRWRTAAVVEVERALAAQDFAGAEATLAALERAPQGERASVPLREELEYGKRQAQYLATAAPATELTLVERKPVVYPPDALQRGIEGWVEIEFVVDTAGRPRDLVVTAAEPRGRFDEAALAALREYRYRPFELDGRVFERRVRLRTRFALQ